MAIEKDLRRVEMAMEQLNRIGRSRRSDARWSARAGVYLPRAAQNILRQVVAQGPARISDLARAAHMGDAAVSRQVTLLEKEGLLRRGSSPEDGRVSLVHVTGKGRRASSRLQNAVDEIFAEQLAGWSRRDLARLAELMEHLVRDLRSSPGAKE
jgi:DNA-binding MarR family transcriptional regulator